jgi:cold shock protein
MESGRIKKLARDRGFGFISNAEGNEVFFHRSECQQFDDLKEGDAVTFDQRMDPKGLRASNVRTA